MEPLFLITVITPSRNHQKASWIRHWGFSSMPESLGFQLELMNEFSEHKPRLCVCGQHSG